MAEKKPFSLAKFRNRYGVLILSGVTVAAVFYLFGDDSEILRDLGIYLLGFSILLVPVVIAGGLVGFLIAWKRQRSRKLGDILAHIHETAEKDQKDNSQKDKS